MRRAAAGVLIAMAIAGTCLAEVGDLTFVQCQPGEGLSGSFAAVGREFGKPAEGAGTVNPRAQVCKLQLGDTTVWVAVDTKAADGAVADTLRFDFTGQGKFGTAMSVPLKVQSAPEAADYVYGRFEPTTLQIQRDGKAMPVTVTGYYYKSSGTRQLVLQIGVAAEGQCGFGDKTHKVRIVDGDGNLRLNDAARPPSGLIVNRPAQAGDTVIVQIGQEQRKHYYGQPIFLDGKWYELTVSPDASKVAAKPADVSAGKLSVAQTHWMARLSGQKGMIVAQGGKDPVPVPAGKYTLVDMAVSADDGGKAAQVLATSVPGMGSGGKQVAVEVPAGGVAEMKVGPPLTAEATARISGTTVRLDLAITGVGGETVRMDAAGEEGGLPKFNILDAKGKQVYAGQFAYG